MFISFPQFVYCSRDFVYFPKLSCLITAEGGTLNSKWATNNGCYAAHSWRRKATYEVTAAFWCHVVRVCLGDVSNKHLAIIANNQFTNLIEYRSYFNWNIHESGVFVDISGLVHVCQFRRNRRSTIEQIIQNKRETLTSLYHLYAYPHKSRNICIARKIQKFIFRDKVVQQWRPSTDSLFLRMWFQV